MHGVVDILDSLPLWLGQLHGFPSRGPAPGQDTVELRDLCVPQRFAIQIGKNFRVRQGLDRPVFLTASRGAVCADAGPRAVASTVRAGAQQ